MKILLAVDGSECSLEGVRNLIAHARWYRAKPQVELVNVQPLLPYEGRVNYAVGRDRVQRYYREQGEAALAGARQMLDAAGIEYRPHIFIGPVAETLVEQAKALGCDLIAMGTHGRTLLGQAMLGSVALKVLHAAEVPVQLVRLAESLRDSIFTAGGKPASAEASGRRSEMETR
jgi:nucleotide-binding universal stress UspA family protein